MTDTVIRNKHLTKAKKLLELSKRGVDGERDSAKIKLDEHLKKHGIDISEIDDACNLREFKVSSYDEFTILSNIILSVNPYTKISDQKGIVKCELDKEDFEEVKNKHKHFWNLWRVEYDLLVLSFFTRHEAHFRPDQYAYEKNRGDGKKENPAFKQNKRENTKLNKNIEQVVEMTPPKEFNAQETAKQRIERMNLRRMQDVLPLMLKSTYFRGKKE